MAERRVAVTGAGIVSPLGATLEDFYRGLCEARSGVRRLPPEVAQNSGVHVAAMIDWNPAPLFREAEAANLDRASQFAIAAAGQAIAASALQIADLRERAGVYWGTGLGGSHPVGEGSQKGHGGPARGFRPPSAVVGRDKRAGAAAPAGPRCARTLLDLPP